MCSFDEAPSSTLHRMLTVLPSVHEGDRDIAGCFSNTSASWIVVVDANQRALGLLTPAAAMVGEILTATHANVHSTPTEVAQRISTGHAEPSTPVIVNDNAGRYLGVVPIRRLLAHLAGTVSLCE